MNKTLAFLECLGRDARLAQSSPADLASAALAAGVEPQLAGALGRRDHVAFKNLFSAVLLSLGLALPPDGYAMVAAPSETESTDDQATPEPESPPERQANSPSTPSNDKAPEGAATIDPAPSGSGEPDPASEAEIEGDVSEGEENSIEPDGENGADETSQNASDETSDESSEESSEDGENADPEEDVIET